jgi:hypothetical protein
MDHRLKHEHIDEQWNDVLEQFQLFHDIHLGYILMTIELVRVYEHHSNLKISFY